MRVDKRFFEHFTNLRQVFLYVIDQCNLDCIQCLYKPNNYFHLSRHSIDINEAKGLLSVFYEMGARKLTLMGGEPTLYDKGNNNLGLFELIRFSHDIGYEYIRIDTNGMFDQKVLWSPEFRLLDEITFSLDGPSSSVNDLIRGRGVFDECVNNIRTATSLGYKCAITCCIHKGLIERDPSSGKMVLESMIDFAASIGVANINFHDLFKSRIPRDTWSGNIGISVDEWISLWPEVLSFISDKSKRNIGIRIPQSIIPRADFDKNPLYYGYCSAKQGDRVLVHPDGSIRICSLLIGTPYCVANYHDDLLVWNDCYTNELLDLSLSEYTPCSHQYKGLVSSLCPLCVSFKPGQDEYVWNKLQWENRSTK